MAVNQFYNPEQIKKAISILKPNGQLFEIRILGSDKKRITSGYFKEADTLLKELPKINLRDQNVYITLNHVREDLFSRKQSERLLVSVNTTCDTEITGYEWLFIDLDPSRPTGISSSKEEFDKAKAKARQVYEYLNTLGFNDPVKAVSGNGCHLLYRIRLGNTPENVRLIENCLKVLATLFNDDFVKIDTTNSNPSRICKLHGTVAQKGADTEERPHRLSYIFSDNEEYEVNDKAYLEKLVAELPDEDLQTQSIKCATYDSNNNAVHVDDIEGWIQDHGLTICNTGQTSRAIMYQLAHCPFNYNHADGDSKIFKYSDGTVAFKCHHNSCIGKTFNDVRDLLEPEWRVKKTDIEDRRIEEGWKQHNRDKQTVKYEEIKPEQPCEPMFLTLKMINDLPDPEQEYIKTGYKEIDNRMRGLEKTKVSVVTGLRGSGKSTWLSNLMLNAINDGHNVICYSGELPKKGFSRWMYQQAAGRNKTIKSKKFENSYYVDAKIKNDIALWVGDRLWLYNNSYGNNFRKIAEVLPQIIQEHKADLVIIDNLMALDLTDISRTDKYEAQTRFVLELNNLAKLSNTHIVFVAHPKKSTSFLRLDDISGTGNLSNAVDNAFLIHRNNADFRRLTAEMFKWKPDNPIYDGTNVIEVAKNREDGVQDLFIPLYYEVETKRLKNDSTENIIYGWNDGFEDATTEDIPF